MCVTKSSLQVFNKENSRLKQNILQFKTPLPMSYLNQRRTNNQTPKNEKYVRSLLLVGRNSIHTIYSTKRQYLIETN